MVRRAREIHHGQVTLLFAAQDRWREQVNWFGTTTLQLVVGDRIWRKAPYQATLPLLRLNAALELYQWLNIGQGSISASHPKDMQGTSARCVDVTFNAYAKREICLDANTGLPLRVKDARGASWATETHEVNILSGDYLPLGLKRFPHHIRYSRYGETELELNIDSVTALENPPADAFKPPEEAGSMPWCPDEQPPRLVLSGPSPAVYWMPGANRSYSVLMVGGSRTSEFSMVVFDVGSDAK